MLEVIPANLGLWSILKASITVFLSIFLLKLVSRRHPPSRHARLWVPPLVGYDGVLGRLMFMSRAGKYVAEGYKRYQDRVFRTWDPEGYRYVVPPSYLKDFERLRDDDVEKTTAGLMLLPEYTGFSVWKDGVDVLKFDISSRLDQIIPGLVEEIRCALESEFPQSQEWIEFQLVPSMLNIIASSVGQILSTQSLSHSKEWKDTVFEFMNNIFQYVGVLKMTPLAIRPIVARVLPWRYKIMQCRKNAQNLTLKTIEQLGLGRGAEGRQDLALDMLHFAWARGVREDDSHAMSETLLWANLAGVHTTGLTCCAALLEICAHPYATEIIIDEIRETFPEGKKEITKEALERMVKLDSIIRESQRLNPLTCAVPDILLRNDICFEGMSPIPAKSILSVAAHGIARDSRIHHDPDTFDPLRFYKLNSGRHSSEAKRYQISSIGHDMVSFGVGKHACPGRFLASLELKALIIELFRNYEIVLADKKGGKRDSVRKPPNWELGLSIIPNPAAKLWIRRRPVPLI